MSENELTKDAEYMLCALYKSYLDRRKNAALSAAFLLEMRNVTSSLRELCRRFRQASA